MMPNDLIVFPQKLEKRHHATDGIITHYFRKFRGSET
jgi:hypothetical protein